MYTVHNARLAVLPLIKFEWVMTSFNWVGCCSMPCRDIVKFYCVLVTVSWICSFLYIFFYTGSSIYTRYIYISIYARALSNADSRRELFLHLNQFKYLYIYMYIP